MSEHNITSFKDFLVEYDSLDETSPEKAQKYISDTNPIRKKLGKKVDNLLSKWNTADDNNQTKKADRLFSKTHKPYKKLDNKEKGNTRAWNIIAKNKPATS